MSPSGDLEAQAARLFALAIAARERGNWEQADELTQLALQYMEGVPDAAPDPAPCSPAPTQPVVQQQQQPQHNREKAVAHPKPPR